MAADDVDRIVSAWRRERPGLDVAPLEVFSRVSRLARRLDLARGTAFAEHGVSIETVRQQVAPGEGERARLIIVTHRASDAALSATVDALAGLDSVDDVASVLRVEGA